MNKHNHGDYLVPWRRLALVIGLSGLVGIILLWLPILAKPRQEQTVQRWETVLDEDFVDAPLSDSWIVTDTSDLDGGEYYWGTATLTQTGEMTYTTPITALWSVGGGADGISLTAGVSTYTDGVDSWAIYGPLDVSHAFDGDLAFDWWLDTATGTAGGPGFYRTQQTTIAPQNGDWLGWCVLMDINDLEDCQGTYVSGSSGQWLNGTLSLKSCIQASHVTTGNQAIWIAFRFISDNDGRVGLGAFVDNLVLRLNYGFEVYLPLVIRNYPPASVLNPIPAPVDRSYEVTWLEIDADIDHYVLQQARSSDFVSADQVWTTTLTSQDVTDAYCAYYYRVRADKATGWGEGDWSNVEQGVASPPDPPVLNDIPELDTNGHYTVSWSAVTVPVNRVAIDRYVLQESADAGFGTITHEWQITETSQLVQPNASSGILYYRVRADDDDCWGQGAWSEAKSFNLQTNYYDNFDNASSGWITHQANCCLDGCDDMYGGRENLDYKYSLYYEGGRYHTYIPTNCLEGGNHGWTRHIYPVSFAPGIKRPSSRTCIEMRGSFEKFIWVSQWGLVFAASDDKSTFYVLWVDDRGDWAVRKWQGYQFPGPNHSYLNETRIDIVERQHGHKPPANPHFETNTLRVEIEATQVKFYVNGQHVHTLEDMWYVNEIRSLKNVGIFGGNWEWGDTQIGYDYFYVDEGCDTY